MEREERDPQRSYEEDAWCFGFDRDCYLKIEAKDDWVGSVWFDLKTGEAGAGGRLRQALEAINAPMPSIIADYFLDFTGPVSDAAVLDDHFTVLRRTPFD